MGTDAGNDCWSEGKGSSAMTTDMIRHHLVMGASHADAELYPNLLTIVQILLERVQIR